MGIRAALGVPGAVMAGSFLGFGALLAGNDHGIAEGMLVTLIMWAMPAQVVLVQLWGQGAPLLAIALAVTLTSVRLMPMVISILPYVRLKATPRWQLYLLAHFIAVTVWILALIHLDRLARPRRLPFLLGLGGMLLASMLAIQSIGYYLAHYLPVWLAAGLVFLTPSYFFISLFTGARRAMDYMAIALGSLIAPLAYRYFPDLDMVIAGIGGGTLAWIIGHLRQRGRS